MNKLLLKYAKLITKLTKKYRLGYLATRRFVAVSKFGNGWNEEAFEELEQIRVMALNEGHFFEEALVLLDEKYLLHEHNGDASKIEEVSSKLRTLKGKFEIPDEELIKLFKQTYIDPCNNRIYRKKTTELLTNLFTLITEYLNSFLEWMDYHTSLICSIVNGKLALCLPGLPLPYVLENIINEAMMLTNMGDYENSMKAYDRAYDIATEHHDRTYQLITLIRKVSIVQSSYLDPLVDFDVFYHECIDRLIFLCDNGKTTPAELARIQLAEEEANLAKASVSEKKEWIFRIERLNEAKPILDFLISLSRGAFCTSEAAGEELKTAEEKAYGGDKNHSMVDITSLFFAAGYNHPARAEHEKHEKEMSSAGPDPVYEPNYNTSITPLTLYRKLMSKAYYYAQLEWYESADNCLYAALDVALNERCLLHAADSWAAMGSIDLRKGDLKNSEIHKKKALELLGAYEKESSIVPRETFQCHMDLGSLYLGLRKYPDALYEFSMATDSADRMSVSLSVYRADALIGCARTEMLRGNNSTADQYGTEALRIICQDIRKRAPLMSEYRRWHYISSLQERTEAIFSILTPQSANELITTAYETLLLTKELSLTSEYMIKELVRKENSGELNNLYDKYLQRLSYAREWGDPEEAGEDASEVWNQEDFMLEARLTQAVRKLLPSEKEGLCSEFSSIRSIMIADQVLIDFSCHTLPDGDRLYTAFIIRKNAECPCFVKLCRESEIISVLNETSLMERRQGQSPTSLDNNDRDAANSSLNDEPGTRIPDEQCMYRLYGLLWMPIMKTGILPENEVVFVPAGALNDQIPLEALVSEDNTAEALADRYKTFRRLSHAREILSMNRKPSFSNIMLIGNLNYGGNHAEEEDKRGSSHGIATHWKRIPNTTDEIHEIKAVMKEAGVECRVLEKDACGDTDFLGLSGTETNILHIATHGFFYSMEECVDSPVLRCMQYPLDRTGIVLSNGNEGWLKGSPQHHEGIVTAAQIARMDLSSVRLVVLTCCSLGKSTARSDGMYGLVKALKKAGAGTVIVSLWGYKGKKDIGLLYYRMIFNGFTPDQALNEVRREMRNRDILSSAWAGLIAID